MDRFIALEILIVRTRELSLDTGKKRIIEVNYFTQDRVIGGEQPLRGFLVLGYHEGRQICEIDLPSGLGVKRVHFPLADYAMFDELSAGEIVTLECKVKVIKEEA